MVFNIFREIQLSLPVGCDYRWASLNKNLTALNNNHKQLLKFNGVKRLPLEAGKNLTAVSINGLK
jgi:hypothetical protein